MSEHARLSPSKAQRFIACPGSLALEEQCEDRASVYAMEGTAAHTLLEWCLTDGRFYAGAYEGRIIEVKEKGEQVNFLVDEDMIEYVQDVVDQVLARMENYKTLGKVVSIELLAEQRADLSYVLGIENQFGTADIVILAEYERDTVLFVGDLKYGQGVEVHAVNPDGSPNEQLATYALGIYDYYSLLHNIQQIDMAIYMPRKGYTSEHSITSDELTRFGETLKDAAEVAITSADLYAQGKIEANKLDLTPGEKQCRFCKAKAKCPAMATQALNTVIGDFDDLTDVRGDVVRKVKDAVGQVDNDLISVEQLNEFMNAADLIEDWVKAVRSRVEAELFNGKDVEDFMLAEGRKGRRAWDDLDEAEETMKSMRLKQDEMYTRKLISPTQAEKLLKDSPRRWNRLADRIVQPDGKPSVVRKDSGKKPYVVKPVLDDFENIEDTHEELA